MWSLDQQHHQHQGIQLHRLLDPTPDLRDQIFHGRGPQRIRNELIRVDHWSNPHSFCVHLLLRTFGIPVAYTEDCMCLALLSHADVTCLPSVSLLSSLTQ